MESNGAIHSQINPNWSFNYEYFEYTEQIGHYRIQ